MNTSYMSDIEVGEEVVILVAGGLFPMENSEYSGFVGKLRSKETYEQYATVHCMHEGGEFIVVTTYIRATPLLKALF